jgi:glutamate racemase
MDEWQRTNRRYFNTWNEILTPPLLLVKKAAPIGIFDSGIGGLTVLKEITKILPQYDYVYLGDNARAPYGTRSFETVNDYTLECVKKLFSLHCSLVIVACNTASAKALRTIQQTYLPAFEPNKKVLGVIRPTTEVIGTFSKTNRVGVLGTTGTVASESYKIEIQNFFPKIKVYQQACPMWVPLIENHELHSPATDYFVKKYLTALLKKDKKIDAIILGCTHYPLLLNKIKKIVPKGIQIIPQGKLVATSLKDYLCRHPEIEKKISRNKKIDFLTTDSSENFNKLSALFFPKKISSAHIGL